MTATPPPLDGAPPHDRHAERSVLGSMLRDNHCIADVVQEVRRDDFYLDAHQRIFDAMISLWDHPSPVDSVLLADELHKAGKLDDVGSYPYLADLWDCAPTAANAVYYAKIVRERSVQRQLIHAGRKIATDATTPTGEMEDMLQDAESLIFRIAESHVAGDVVDMQAVVNQALARIDAQHSREKASDEFTVRGIPTGFADLDELLCGLQPSELTILAARPSVGKTAFALNVARNATMLHDYAALFVSLEMSRIELAERMLVLESQVDGHRLRTGRMSQDDYARLIDAADRTSSAKLFIDDCSGQDMLRISSTARMQKRRRGISLIIVDYLQLIDPERARGQETRNDQVAKISRRLKFLARELEVPVLALAQLNRNVENANRRPRLADLRDSGSIEQDADVVLFLHRDQEDEMKFSPNPTIDVIVEKQRNGRTGTSQLVFRKATMRFESQVPGVA